MTQLNSHHEMPLQLNLWLCRVCLLFLLCLLLILQSSLVADFRSNMWRQHICSSDFLWTTFCPYRRCSADGSCWRDYEFWFFLLARNGQVGQETLLRLSQTDQSGTVTENMTNCIFAILDNNVRNRHKLLHNKFTTKLVMHYQCNMIHIVTFLL